MDTTVRLAQIVTLLLMVAGAAYAGLQLTPRQSSYEVEGTRFSQFAFSDGEKEVTYTPPAGWDCAGDGEKLTLNPRGRSAAGATITKVPLEATFSFDEAALKKLTEEALVSVPAGSEEVKLLSQEKNPLFIEGKETFLVIMSYTYYGEAYSRSVMFMNRQSEQIRFQLTSRSAEFPELQQAFLASHYSWQNL